MVGLAPPASFFQKDKLAVMENRMATRREICIWLAFSIVCTLAIWPPWTEVVPVSDGGPPMHRKLWNAPLWRTSIEEEFDAMVDYPRMLTEIAVSECLCLPCIWCGGAEVAG